MQKKVLDYMKQHHMFALGDRVLVAVSGGADSVCLLVLLCELREQLGLSTITAVHMHHGLRGPEADRDAEYVRKLCEELDVPCTILYRDVAAYAQTNGYSIEEAGRILRYEAFDEEMTRQNLTRLAVAHHQDDQAETILYHLVRGSGLKGLAGISPVRGQIVRPLLCVRRKEIETFLFDHHLTYCADSTNEIDCYTRNKIRQKWIPLALDINEGAVQNICQAGQFVSQADAYLEEQAECLLRQYGTLKKTAAETYAEIPITTLEREPQIIRTYLIRLMIRWCTDSMRNITSGHISQILELPGKQTGSHTDLPDRLAAERNYETIRIFSTKPTENKKKSLGTLHFRKLSVYNAGEIPKNQYTKWLDYDKIKGTLSLRTRAAGDYITIAEGQKKRLKAYFIDEKIPRQLRDEIPLLAEKNHIVWIVGYRISEYYKITKETKTILEVTVYGGEYDEGKDSSVAF